MEITVESGWSDDGADITNAVKNIQQMIFCMIWLNVAEWVADVQL
jgi:hypothetical protein